MQATIHNVKPDELNNYNPDMFDAIPQSDGTFMLVPLLWHDQTSYNEYQYGCGDGE